ncbi:MAG TPA: hypothetical protein VGP32_06405 [Steroidobacteraceae bacterium]|jgi:hypothetical protein|nr:hypothetical protein [Steroidobacteraceae bacterium]
MFKKLVPVIALALLAGPVLAADAPATPAADQSASAPAKSHKKSSSHHKKSTSKKSSSTDSSATAPAK